MKYFRLKPYIPPYLRKAFHDGKADRINRITAGETMPDMSGFKLYCPTCGARLCDCEGGAPHVCKPLESRSLTGRKHSVKLKKP